MQPFDTQGRLFYLTEDKRSAFLRAISLAPREVRTFCAVLHATGCRVSEALALPAARIDLTGRVLVFETLKKCRAGTARTALHF